VYQQLFKDKKDGYTMKRNTFGKAVRTGKKIEHANKRVFKNMLRAKTGHIPCVNLTPFITCK
jgi:hypothetical protein